MLKLKAKKVNKHSTAIYGLIAVLLSAVLVANLPTWGDPEPTVEPLPPRVAEIAEPPPDVPTHGESQSDCEKRIDEFLTKLYAELKQSHQLYKPALDSWFESQIKELQLADEKIQNSLNLMVRRQDELVSAQLDAVKSQEVVNLRLTNEVETLKARVNKENDQIET